MIPGLAILISLQLVGELIAWLLHLPIPGGLLGLLLLLAYLLVRRHAGTELKSTAQALLQNMMLLFIPLIAGIIDQVDYIREQWLAFLGASILGALLTLVVSAWTLQVMLRRQDRLDNKKQ